MPSTTEVRPSLPGAGTDEAFRFSTGLLNAPAGYLSENKESLPASRLAAEMARLAEDAYDKTTRDAVGRGWDALTASELGIAKGSGSVRYSFKDGVYQGDRSGSSEGQALVLSRTVGDKSVLAVAFRGTVDLIDQYKDYFPFDRHYKVFMPLIKAVKEFVADKANGIDKVVVTGHSLGAAMAQLFLNENLDVPVSGYTFGSPGADHARKKAKLLNFDHENDVIPDLAGIKDERSGGVVTIDRNGLDGLRAPHAIEQYMKTTTFLSNQALDKDGPFHSHGLAEALRTGGNYRRDVRLEIGTDKDDVLKPFAEDRFSLAGDGDDRFRLRKGELVEKKVRDFDGGNGDDRVVLPHNKFRKDDGAIFDVIERNDGGMALKFDARTGSKDKWKTVGVFYRTETIVYDNGKAEPFAEAATKIAPAYKGDLLVG